MHSSETVFDVAFIFVTCIFNNARVPFEYARLVCSSVRYSKLIFLLHISFPIRHNHLSDTLPLSPSTRPLTSAALAVGISLKL